MGLKVMIAATEVTPFAKSGGLGDVIGSLPRELVKNGVDARVVMPKYQNIRGEYLKNLTYIGSFELSLGWRAQSASVFRADWDFPVYLIENDFYFGRDGFYGYGDDFERFAFFSKAAVEFLGTIDFQPDILHFNDWQTALGSVYLKDQYRKFKFFSEMKALYTVHNLQYQGIFGRETLGNADLNDGYFTGGQLEFGGNVSYMKAGLLYADAISTVSETYAMEIQTPFFGYGVDGVLRQHASKLYGILNGIDVGVNNPETDAHLFSNFSADALENKKTNKSELQKRLNLEVRADVPVIALISRLVDQKGLSLIADAAGELMSRDIQFVALGAGDGRYEHLLWDMAGRFPGRVSANICFDEDLAQKIYGGADMFLMPSLFEPCGLGQMIAMRYGAVPIVRRTGGLADTVIHYDPYFSPNGCGFVFEHYLGSGMMWAVDRAIETYRGESWERVVRNAMSRDFTWGRSAKRYIELYNKIKEG